MDRLGDVNLMEVKMSNARRWPQLCVAARELESGVLRDGNARRPRRLVFAI
jgi:hypothetical protein